MFTAGLPRPAHSSPWAPAAHDGLAGHCSKQVHGCPFDRLSNDGRLAEQGDSDGCVCACSVPGDWLLVLCDVTWCPRWWITLSSCFDAGGQRGRGCKLVLPAHVNSKNDKSCFLGKKGFYVISFPAGGWPVPPGEYPSEVSIGVCCGQLGHSAYLWPEGPF